MKYISFDESKVDTIKTCFPVRLCDMTEQGMPVTQNSDRNLPLNLPRMHCLGSSSDNLRIYHNDNLAETKRNVIGYRKPRRPFKEAPITQTSFGIFDSRKRTPVGPTGPGDGFQASDRNWTLSWPCLYTDDSVVLGVLVAEVLRINPDLSYIQGCGSNKDTPQQ